MQSIYSYFGYSKNEANQESDDTIDDLARFMPVDQQEEMMCFTLSDCQVYDLVAKNGKQVKECEFINSNVNITTMLVPSTDEADSRKINVPVVFCTNEDFDEDQDQKQDDRIPVAEELIFMRYTDGGEFEDNAEDDTIVHGFVFFFPTMNVCKVIECAVDSQEVSDQLDQFSQWICRILYVSNEQTRIFSTKNRDKACEQENRIAKYCINTSVEVILNQKNINDIFVVPESSSVDQPISSARAKKHKSKVSQAKQMSELVKEQRFTSLTAKMGKLRVGQEDLRELSTVMVEMAVEERLLQVLGHFFKYDPISDKNIMVHEGLFLCIDRVVPTDKSATDTDFKYMLHVVDQQGKLSFCRAEISGDRKIQLMQQQSTLMWIGDAKADGTIPAWQFYVANESEIQALKGVLTKALYETNTREIFQRQASKASQDSDTTQDNDRKWLEDQLVADRNGDVEMEGSQGPIELSDFDLQELQDDLDWYERETEVAEQEENKNAQHDPFEDSEEAELDADLDPEFRNQGNRECMQAMGYDRAFVVNGPVVKVYKNGEDDLENQQLKYLMHLPVIYDKKNQVIEPSNMLMHNNESGMMFVDKNNTNRVINYDLEKGVVVDEILTNSGLEGLSVSQLANEHKNGQQTPGQLFQGITQKSMFTLDPRLDTTDKIAKNRAYKKDPQFSTLSTSLTGGLAIGSANGDIRLYKSVGMDAKTLLPGMGDAINSIEVSRDGNWVLATTKTYLLVIPTLCANGKTGFEHRMGKEKPIPKKLQIKVQDQAKYGISKINFKPARFNNFTATGEESSIVCSTGDYLVTWNFRKVQRGIMNDYQIKQLNTTPVDNQFRLDHEDKILVTDQTSVGVQTRKKKVAIQY